MKPELRVLRRNLRRAQARQQRAKGEWIKAEVAAAAGYPSYEAFVLDAVRKSRVKAQEAGRIRWWR